MNVCRSCETDFATVAAFDDHRVGTHDYTYSEGAKMDPPREDGRRCLKRKEREELGWLLDQHGRWLAPRKVAA